MTSFIRGIVVGVVLVAFVDIVILLTYNTKSKRILAQESSYNKYYYSDSLWYRTSEQKQIDFSYKGHPVSLWVQHIVFNGTDRNCKMHKIFINNKDCATVIKIRDSYQYYFCAYVNEPFIEEEVWDILKSAYYYIDQQEKEKENKESIFKESVLK